MSTKRVYNYRAERHWPAASRITCLFQKAIQVSCCRPSGRGINSCRRIWHNRYIWRVMYAGGSHAGNPFAYLPVLLHRHKKNRFPENREPVVFHVSRMPCRPSRMKPGLRPVIIISCYGPCRYPCRDHACDPCCDHCHDPFHGRGPCRGHDRGSCSHPCRDLPVVAVPVPRRRRRP